MHQTRVAAMSLSPYLRTAQKAGIDVTPLLAEIGLTPENINQKQTRILSSQAAYLIQRIIELSENKWFGLVAALNIDISNYDINGYISLNCTNPLEAISLTAKYHGIISDQRVLQVTETSQHLVSQWNLDAEITTVTRNMIDHLMASYVTYGRQMLHFESAPKYATFRHAAPKDSKILELYERIFSCPLHFNEDVYSLAIDREMARYSEIPFADPMLRDVLVGHAEKRIREIQVTPPLTYQVKELIKKELEATVPSRDHIAEKLNIGSRTLQRRLISEGTSYKDAFNEVRQELALHYMNNESMTLDDIAEKLGFSETRSFHRSFKQWTGETIGNYRHSKKTDE